ncbi:AAA family ATPase [Nonomuraea angiospora]|uniref:AAA family ATPase n=1 Tax=Nonomuraea angiospora TaxID=46172 RepID=UPI0029B922C8|nr:AAA family ATPase [Nonomuraea angiospora]MDX3110458.1 AAA family ATPase [Nonomuraea angiospora]
MQFAERESEITLLNTMLAESEHGWGRIAMITGPPGFDKSRVLHAFADSAVRSGATHLSAICLRNEQNISLGVIHQVSQSLSAALGEMPPALKLLQEAVFNAGPRGIRPEDLNWIGVTHGLWEIITNHARHGAVLITIEDVQYADSVSLDILLHFINRLHAANVFMVFTVNEGPDGVPLRIQSDLMHHPQCRRIKVAPYSSGTISRIAQMRLGTEPDDPLAEAIHQVSGGNALLVRSLIEDRQNAGGDGTGLVVDDGFSGSVRTLLNRIGSTPLRILRAAAVLDASASPPLLAEMLHIKQPAVVRTLEWLAEIGLLGLDGFRHPAAREAVLDSMEPELLKELYGRAAQLLHATGVQPTVIADHLVAASTKHEPWALDVLREAADQALATDEYELAVRYLRYAADLCSGPDERIQVTLALAKATWRINPSTATMYLPMLVQAARDGRLPARDVHWLLTCMLWHGQYDEAEEMFALLEQAEQGEGPEAGGAHAWRLAADHWLASTHPPILHRLRGTHKPTPLREGSERHPAHSYARTISALAANLRDGETEAALRTAEKVLHSVQLEGCNIELVEAALFCFVYSDRTHEAASLVENLYALAERRASPTWLAVLAAFRAHIAEHKGEMLEAVEWGELSLRILPPRSLGVLAALPLASLIEAHTEMGEYQKAEQYLRHPLPETVYQTRYGLHYLFARGHYRTSVGQAHAGLSDFLKCGTLMRSWEVDTPLLVPWRLGAAGVSVVLKNNARARKFLELHHATPHGHSPRIRGFALMVLASAEEVGRRPPLLRKAVDMLQDSGHKMELAHALARLSHSLAALGETDKARLIGQQADRVGQRCHAEPLRRSVANAFDSEFGVMAAGNDQNALSPAEYRVASMAALGYTNREIATRAHITISTVEQHLTRIYRKLGVNGRNDLPRLFSSKELGSSNGNVLVAENSRHLPGSASVPG